MSNRYLVLAATALFLLLVAVYSNHFHNGFEECIYVMSGTGYTEADSGNYPLKAGDTILIPSGEKHATRNTGTEPLVLLCFFPVADISRKTEEEKRE